MKIFIVVLSSTLLCFASTTAWRNHQLATRQIHQIVVVAIQGGRKEGQHRRSTSTALPVSWISDLTVQQANNLSTPFFVFSSFPWLFFAYLLNRMDARQCPKGVSTGYALLVAFGCLAGPMEALSQALYGVSFFDADWIHGTITQFFVTGYLCVNLSFLQALRGDSDEFPSLKLAGALISISLAVAASQWALGADVHSQCQFGILDQIIPPRSKGLEPANALSAATWFNHIWEITQNQMSIRLASQWAQYAPGWQRIAQSLVVLQWSSISVLTFHFFYNQIPILLLSFAVLLAIGTSLAGYEAWKFSQEKEEEFDSSLMQLADASFDDSLTYIAKSVVVGLGATSLVKYASVELLAPSTALQSSTPVAVGIAVVLCAVCVRGSNLR